MKTFKEVLEGKSQALDSNNKIIDIGDAVKHPDWQTSLVVTDIDMGLSYVDRIPRVTAIDLKTNEIETDKSFEFKIVRKNK